MEQRVQYGRLTLHSSGQLWSNPSARGQEEFLPAMLVNPSFLDLLQLSCTYTPDRLLAINDSMLEQGAISALQNRINRSMLDNIRRGLDGS